MERTFKKDYGLACEDRVNLKWESESVEKVYETLLEKLKRRICADFFMNKENYQLEE